MLNKLRFENFIVFVVASFDIVIILLNKNQIVHFQFKISLNFDENSFCNISKKNKINRIDSTNEIDILKRVFHATQIRYVRCQSYYFRFMF